MDTAWKNIEIRLCFRGIMLQKIWVDDAGCTEKITFIGEDEHRVRYLTAAVIRYMLAFIGEFMQNIIHVIEFFRKNLLRIFFRNLEEIVGLYIPVF